MCNISIGRLIACYYIKKIKRSDIQQLIDS
jgi:hypothetical protein